MTLGVGTIGQMLIQDKLAFATASTRTPQKTIEQLLAMAQELITKNDCNLSDIASIGISCGGPLNSQRGVILGPPNLPGWDDVEIVKQI